MRTPSNPLSAALALTLTVSILAPVLPPPSASAQTTNPCLTWKVSGARKSDFEYVEFSIPTGPFFPYFDTPPPATSAAYLEYAKILTAPEFLCVKRQESVTSQGPVQGSQGPSTADAVRRCSVDVAAEAVGGKLLDSLGQAGKSALSYLGNAGKDVAKGLGLGDILSGGLDLGLNIALPGVGSLLGGIGKSILGGVGDALGLGNIFGGGEEEPQKVTEVGEQLKETKKIQFGNCLKAIKDEAYRIALESFRKRLLDRMVDDIVAWISDGRDPKFITNFGDFLGDAAQAAIGDTARAVGLAELCTPFRYRLPILLKPVPKFSQQVSCTLDDIVGNIEEFYEDFSRGGFLAYAELWSPQNNPHGAALKIYDEVLKKTSEKSEEARVVALAGGGYKPVRQCLEWSATSLSLSLGRSRQVTRAVGPGFDYPNPLAPPPPGSPAYESVAQALGGGPVTFTCSRDEITLPPAGTSQIAASALAADTQQLANASDLSRYTQAIHDAVFNRIRREGVKALRGNPSNLQSESSTGRPPARYIPEGVDPAAYCSSATLATLSEPERSERERNCRYAGYGNQFATSSDFSAQLRNELRTQITGLRDEINAASTTLAGLVRLNQELLATSTALGTCEIVRSVNAGEMCVNTSSSIVLARARALQFDVDRAELTNILSQLTAINQQVASNPSLSESTLSALLATLTTSRSAVQAISARFQTLGALLTVALNRNRQAREACETTATYSCSWTPPSP